MDAIKHKPARLYNCEQTGITIVQNKHTKILGLKGVRYLVFNPQIRGLLWQSSTVWVQQDTSFLRYLNFQEKIWNKNWWMTHRLDQSTRAIPRGGYRARIFPTGFLVHQTYKAYKIRSCYLTTGLALFTLQEPGGHYFSSRETCWHHLPPTSQQPQNATTG